MGTKESDIWEAGETYIFAAYILYNLSQHTPNIITLSETAIISFFM